MNLDKRALDNYLTAAPDYEDVFVVCPRCGEFDCPNQEGYLPDLGETSVCPHCRLHFEVKDEHLMTQKEYEARRVDELYWQEFISEEIVGLELSPVEFWHIFKFGMEVRRVIEQQVTHSKYENPKVKDAWVEDIESETGTWQEIYAVVDVARWEEFLGFRVNIDVEQHHSDEPAAERPDSICPKCNGDKGKKKAVVKRYEGEPGEFEVEIEYIECTCGWTQIDL